MKPVQVKSVVEEALKLLRATLPSTIEMRHDIQSHSMVMGDPTQIHQVLINICTNAAHAMQESGGVLDVKLVDVELAANYAINKPDLKPGSYVKLTVCDDGCGMAPDVMGRLFDPFFTTKEKGEGTGLGLSVVHGIVKSHGGAISADSNPGKGSNFDVYFPVIERKAEVEVLAEKRIPTGNERILFVDDEQTIVNMGMKILGSLGYDVSTRTSSIEALELFKSKPDTFDMMITDMTMPNMTGEDLAKEIMTIRPDIPIILCTGFSTNIDEQRAKAMGIRAFVYKPILRQEIAETIRKLLP